jgi:hypothetical protein
MDRAVADLSGVRSEQLGEPPRERRAELARDRAGGLSDLLELLVGERNRRHRGLLDSSPPAKIKLTTGR